MVQHVWERAARCSRIDRLIIATDDERIADASRSFGAEVQITRADHQSGSDRVAEVAQSHPHELVVKHKVT